MSVFPWQILVGLVSLALGVLAFVKGSARLKLVRESRAWPSVAATVLRAGVRRDDEAVLHTYIAYTYDVAGCRYTGKSFSPDGDEGSASPRDVEFVRSIGPGHEILVFYCPRDPSVACVRPGSLGEAPVLFGCGAILTVVGLVFVIRALAGF